MEPVLLNHTDDFWSCASTCGDAFACIVQHRQYYLAGEPLISLFVLVLPAAHGGQLLISDRVARARELVRGLSAQSLGGADLIEIAEALEAPVLAPAGGIKLLPVEIGKPWGREIWYTGIEARGQSRVTDGRFSVPLPWLLALGSESLLDAGAREPNLLKILDPLPEEVFGDLYFELHEAKREVYVVTAVDRDAWPDGTGAIRYGFDQQKRRAAGSDDAFRAKYLAAVKDYEAVRRDIDALLDDRRRREGVALDAPVPAAQLKQWLQDVSPQLRDREQAARATMNAFTHMRPLAVGDVVRVSCLTPHALQHGVRTVEFQTPVYERKILNFAQKVLTQDHWDTEEAVALMNLEPEPAAPLPVIDSGDFGSLEQVVAFDDFRAYRLTLTPGQSYALDGDHYKVVMAVQGTLLAANCRLAAEEAALVPRSCVDSRVVNNGSGTAVCLIALPSR